MKGIATILILRTYQIMSFLLCAIIFYFQAHWKSTIRVIGTKPLRELGDI